MAAADGRFLLFGDDDCVFSPYAAAGSAHTLDALQRNDPTVSAVMLPFYYRATTPHHYLPTTRIGRLDAARARFSTGFHTWPVEYGDDPPLLAGSGVVAPLPVQLIGGTALIDAGWLRRAGGFRDLSAWASSYSDHLHLSSDLTDAGSQLYHCPAPRLSAAHLKFGAAGRFPTFPNDETKVLPGVGRPLEQLIALSSQPRAATGCRVPDRVFHVEMIGSLRAFFAGRSLLGGVAWGARTWREFVVAGRVWSATVTDVPDRGEREAAWREGLTRGARFLVDKAAPGRSKADARWLLAAISQATGQPSVRLP